MTTVLIVEDDPLLMMSTIAMVEDAGFDVVAVANADEAVTILQSRADIGVLLTDVLMPGSLNGAELAHLTCRRWPAMKIIVVSGYVGATELDLPSASVFLQKPYHEEQLVAVLDAITRP